MLNRFIIFIGFVWALSPLKARASIVSFSDSFSPAASSLWSDSSGHWTTSNGQYFAQVPSNSPVTFTGLPFDLTNFTVDVTVNSLGDGGVWLRTEGTDLVNGSPQDGILLVTGGDGYGQGARGGTAGTSLNFNIVQNGVLSGAEEVDNVFTPGTTHNLKVVVSGDTYSAFVDGSTTPTIVFTNSIYSDGDVGLYDDQPNVAGGGSGTPQTFSAFSVSGTTVPEPAFAFLTLGILPLLLRRREHGDMGVQPFQRGTLAAAG
jgi:hypothetical protein